MFKIKHSHGQTESGIETYAAAIALVQSVYGADCEIGHDGDIEGGGESTLVWRDAESAQDDDGSRAVCSIYRTHPPDIRGVSGTNADGTHWELKVGDRVEHEADACDPDSGDTGRISRFVDEKTALVYWDSGVETPCDVADLTHEVTP